MEAGGVFFDMDGNWDEVLVDKRTKLRVAIRFGFQPSACPSSRSGAKVHQHRLMLRLGLTQRALNILVP
jgi:hypothetical protein